LEGDDVWTDETNQGMSPQVQREERKRKEEVAGVLVGEAEVETQAEEDF